jgi:hypothetical protein
MAATRIILKVLGRLAAACTALALALPCAGVTTTIDYGDIWYNAPAESQSGWGVNIAQQGDVLFATMFVYGADGTPRWYVAPSVAATGANAFSGGLFTVATGTWFGAPWTGVSGARSVGNIAFTFDTATTGSMVYTVDNVQVTKSIVRQSWRADVLSGTYVGGVTGFGATCGNNGRIRIPGAIVVTHTPPAFVMTLDFAVSAAQTGRCTYRGNYAQVGSLGTVLGTYSCDVNGAVNVITGSITLDEIRATRNGFTGRIAVVSPQCDYAGYFGGVKDSF